MKTFHSSWYFLFDFTCLQRNSGNHFLNCLPLVMVLPQREWKLTETFYEFQTEGETGMWTLWRWNGNFIEDVSYWTTRKNARVLSSKRKVGYEQCSLSYVYCSKIWKRWCRYGWPCSGDYKHSSLSHPIGPVFFSVIKYSSYLLCRVAWLDYFAVLKSLILQKGLRFQPTFTGGYVRWGFAFLLLDLPSIYGWLSDVLIIVVL